MKKFCLEYDKPLKLRVKLEGVESSEGIMIAPTRGAVVAVCEPGV